MHLDLFWSSERDAAEAARPDDAPRASSLMLQHSDGLVLGVTRKRDAERFAFPSGKRDPGESGLEACVRETLEETGVELDARVVVWLGAGLCDPERPGERRYWVDAFFAYWTPSLGEPRQIEAGVRPLWLPPVELVERGAFPLYNQAVLDARTLRAEAEARRQRERRALWAV
jgi:8-oxo-dGTP pyrophosphatase MutT (NUDIX family)